MSMSLPAVEASGKTWQSLAAACAFVAGGTEILSFVLFRYFYRDLVNPDWKFQGTALTISLVIMAVIGLATQAISLWSISRLQRAVTPVSARLGQWFAATYVVASVLLFFHWYLLGAGKLVSHVSTIAFALACLSLGIAARRGGGPRLRWASGGLVAAATIGLFSLVWRFAGLSTDQGWLGLTLMRLAVDVAMWVAVGVWLLSATRA
jgi:hypothetical protein